MLAAPARDPVPQTGAQAPVFRLRGPLAWRELDGEWVVCAEPSGSLFQLDLLGAAVLGLLEAGGLSRMALLHNLAEAMAEGEASAPAGAASPPVAAPASAALAAALDATLARLVADDLVTTAPAVAPP